MTTVTDHHADQRSRARVPERQWARLQAATGLAFATFLVVHLTNAALATTGQASYDAYLAAVRHYYQATGVELVLVLVAPFLHVTAGVVRARRRRAKAASRPNTRPAPWRVRLHRASGVVLVLAFVGHVVATRGPGLLLDQPADFTFLHYSLDHHPFFFYPYYGLFAASGLYHLVHGLFAAFAIFGFRVSRHWLDVRSRSFAALVVAGVVALWLGIAALGGAFFPVDTGRYAEIEALERRLLEWR